MLYQNMVKGSERPWSDSWHLKKETAPDIKGSLEETLSTPWNCIFRWNHLMWNCWLPCKSAGLGLTDFVFLSSPIANQGQTSLNISYLRFHKINKVHAGFYIEPPGVSTSMFCLPFEPHQTSPGIYIYMNRYQHPPSPAVSSAWCSVYREYMESKVYRDSRELTGSIYAHNQRKFRGRNFRVTDF